jgi:Integral membrane protein
MNEEPVFEAMLSPHRSLGRTGLIIVMTLSTATMIFQIGFFMQAGAWPIAGFLGLDILLLGGALWLNQRAARAREFVYVSRTDLAIRKVAPSGRTADYRWNPFWARFSVARHPEIGITRMKVSGEGRSTEVGSFLNPADKESFASAFRSALADVRR